LYMQKVSEGDRSYVDRLCKQLSDRLVFAPVVSSPASAGGAKKATFSVLRLSEADRLLVPIFTSEKRFKEWGQKREHGGGSISLLGGDFCAALGTDTWVSIDPGFDDGLELEPSLVIKISQSGLNDEPATEDSVEIEVPAPQAPRPQPIPAPAKGIVNNAMFSAQPRTDEFISARDRVGTTSQVPPSKASVTEDTEQAPPGGSKLIRSAMFANSPGAVGDYQADKTLEKAGLASTQILPDLRKSRLAGASLSAGSSTAPAADENSDDDQPKKKKSFLNFLKGG
jgi:hypothetical protein